MLYLGFCLEKRMKGPYFTLCQLVCFLRFVMYNQISGLESDVFSENKELRIL